MAAINNSIRIASENYVDEKVSGRAHIDIEDNENVDVESGLTLDEINNKVNQLQDTINGIQQSGGLPTVSESDNGKIIQVVNGAWALVEVVDGDTTLFYPDGNEVAY